MQHSNKYWFSYSGKWEVPTTDRVENTGKLKAF
jgi:hypothetical protein